jgi:hypothetical protein
MLVTQPSDTPPLAKVSINFADNEYLEGSTVLRLVAPNFLAIDVLRSLQITVFGMSVRRNAQCSFGIDMESKGYDDGVRQSELLDFWTSFIV